MVRRRLRLVVSVLLVAGCSAGGPTTPDVVTASGIGLSLSMPTCNARHSTDVAMSDETIEIGLERVSPGDPNAECADEVLVEVSGGVQGRRVVVNGKTFDVTERR